MFKRNPPLGPQNSLFSISRCPNSQNKAVEKRDPYQEGLSVWGPFLRTLTPPPSRIPGSAPAMLILSSRYHIARLLSDILAKIQSYLFMLTEQLVLILKGLLVHPLFLGQHFLGQLDVLAHLQGILRFWGRTRRKIPTYLSVIFCLKEHR